MEDLFVVAALDEADAVQEAAALLRVVDELDAAVLDVDVREHGLVRRVAHQDLAADQLQKKLGQLEAFGGHQHEEVPVF